MEYVIKVLQLAMADTTETITVPRDTLRVMALFVNTFSSSIDVVYMINENVIETENILLTLFTFASDSTTDFRPEEIKAMCYDDANKTRYALHVRTEPVLDGGGGGVYVP